MVTTSTDTGLSKTTIATNLLLIHLLLFLTEYTSVKWHNVAGTTKTEANVQTQLDFMKINYWELVRTEEPKSK